MRRILERRVLLMKISGNRRRDLETLAIDLHATEVKHHKVGKEPPVRRLDQFLELHTGLEWFRFPPVIVERACSKCYIG